MGRDVRVLFQSTGLWRLDRRVGRGYGAAHPADPGLHRLSVLVAAIPRLLILVLALLAASCRGPIQPYEPLTAQAANLREQFNRDASAVRILILPAPT